MLKLALNAAKTRLGQIKLLPLRTAVGARPFRSRTTARPRQLWKAYGIVLPIGLAAWWRSRE